MLQKGTFNPREMAEQSSSKGAVALSDAVNQVAQGLARVQEILRHQEQEAERSLQEAVRLQVEEVQRSLEETVRQRVEEALRLHGQEAHRRIQEAVRLHEQQAQRRLQTDERRLMIAQRSFREAVRLQEERTSSALRQLQQQLQDRDIAISAIRQSLGEKMPRLEKSVGPISEKSESAGAGDQEALRRLESRVGKLEATVHRALLRIFPRMEALVERWETLPPGAPVSPSASSVALGAAAAAADDDQEHARQQLEQRTKEVERRMLSSRAAPSQFGEALCKTTSPDEVRRLVDSGADINYIDSDGKCPLISALLTDARVVSLLLARGARANSVNLDGRSALHIAVSGRLEDVEVLIAAGADVNARDRDGATPLHYAAHQRDEEKIAKLLAAGANKSLRGWGGIYEDMRPFGMATYGGLRDVLRP